MPQIKHAAQRRHYGKVALAAAAAWFAAETARVQAAPVQWINPSGGDWSVGGNWSTGNPPNTGDDVTNTYSAATITFDTTAAVDGFLNSGSFTMNGGMLSGTQANSESEFVEDSSLTVNAGTLASLRINSGTSTIFAGTAALSNVDFSGGPTFASDSLTTIFGAVTLGVRPTLTGGTLQVAAGAELIYSYQDQTFTPSQSLWYGSINGPSNSTGGAVLIEGLAGNAVFDADGVGQTLTFGSSLSSLQVGRSSSPSNDILEATNGATINVNTPVIIQPSGIIRASTTGYASPKNFTGAPATVNINSSLTINDSANDLDNGSNLTTFNGSTINVTGLFTGTLATISTNNGGTVNVSGGMTGVFLNQGSNAGFNITGGTLSDADILGPVTIPAGADCTFSNLVMFGADSDDSFQRFAMDPAIDQEAPQAEYNYNPTLVTLAGGTLAGSYLPASPSDESGGILAVGTYATFQGYGTIAAGASNGSTLAPIFLIQPGGILDANVPGQALNINTQFVNEGTVEISPGATLNLNIANNRPGAGLPLFGAGSIQCDGALNYTASPTLLMASYDFEWIYGNGVINSNLSNGAAQGRVSPGEVAFPGYAVGHLTITGNYTQSGSAIFDVSLGGYSTGVNTGLLTVNGSISLGGTLDVNLINGFVPNIGDQFTVMTAGLGVTGAFTDLTSNNGLFTYTVDYGTNDNIVELTVTSVPEPAILGTLAINSLLLTRRRRRSDLIDYLVPAFATSTANA